MIPTDETNVLGRPAGPLLRDVIASMLDIIRGAWARLAKEEVFEPAGKYAERKITDKLMGALLAEKKARLGLQSWPRIEEQSATRSRLDAPKPEGAIDFKVIFSADEREYFGLECKRVGASDKHLAQAYLDEGVQRYVDGKYGPGHTWGAMLAIVVDSDLPAAADSIHHWLDFRRQKCGWQGDWVLETCFGSVPELYRSRHLQSGQPSPMGLLHLFVILNAPPP